jgi:Fe-S-cluster containining protein
VGRGICVPRHQLPGRPGVISQAAGEDRAAVVAHASGVADGHQLRREPSGSERRHHVGGHRVPQRARDRLGRHRRSRPGNDLARRRHSLDQQRPSDTGLDRRHGPGSGTSATGRLPQHAVHQRQRRKRERQRHPATDSCRRHQHHGQDDGRRWHADKQAAVAPPPRRSRRRPSHPQRNLRRPPPCRPPPVRAARHCRRQGPRAGVATDLAAGDFGAWVVQMQQALRGEQESDVPCNGCTACCSSSQFVHIGPDETDTLAHIPSGLLFPAPRLPRGHMVLGYDEHGRCPMLADNGCSIYEHRPITCRTYDCRIFPASDVVHRPARERAVPRHDELRSAHHRERLVRDHGPRARARHQLLRHRQPLRRPERRRAPPRRSSATGSRRAAAAARRSCSRPRCSAR